MDQILSFGLKNRVKIFLCETEPRVPLFCPICENVMSNNIDAEAYSRIKACRMCENDFAEPNLELWNKGHRPDRDSIISKKIERNSSLSSRYVINGE